jgi:hypothetical protein
MSGRDVCGKRRDGVWVCYRLRAWRLPSFSSESFSKYRLCIGSVSRQAFAPSNTSRVGADAGRAECVVCMDAARTTRFQPCQHSVCCWDCAQVLLDSTRVCPLCSGRVASVGPLGGSVATFHASSSRTQDGKITVQVRADEARRIADQAERERQAALAAERERARLVAEREAAARAQAETEAARKRLATAQVGCLVCGPPES